MQQYYLAKLATLNYKIAIHPGNANIRLCSQIDQIANISPMNIPSEHQKAFEELQALIEHTYALTNNLGQNLHPYKLRNIQNKAASGYIKLLLDIQYALEDTP